MLRVAVAGASGYMGAEALRLLCVHPKLQLTVVTSERLAGENRSMLLPLQLLLIGPALVFLLWRGRRIG